MFTQCYSLFSIALPATWGSITNVSSMFYGCYGLYSIALPATWGIVTNAGTMFYNCYGLTSITLPASWGSINYIGSMFQSCWNLTSITLPASWGNITNASALFTGCNSLFSVTLPATWGIVTDVSNLFAACYSLFSIALPATWGNITNANSMFAYCYNLKSVVNAEYLGSQTVQCDFTYFMQDCEFLQSNIVINSMVKAIGIYGASGYLLKVTSIRLPNAGSLFAGSSPQINVSYTSLAAAALDALFTDLPVLSGKTINITGCPGAATCTRSIATAKGWTVTG